MFKFLNKIFKTSNKYKLYYFGGRKNKNAGDIYNVDLANYFGIKYTRKRNFKHANLTCVGSTLDKLSIPSKKKILIAGAGFIFPPSCNDRINREVEVLALRGKLSKKRMEDLLDKPLNNCILADPGLIVSKIYPQTIYKKYRVGIIPHYHDKSMWNDNRISLERNSYKIIDIQQDVKDVVKEICECECILSSSLHGLIFADSYNIPNRQLIISNASALRSYKLQDYYSAFDLELPPAIDIRTEVIDNNLIADIINTYITKDVETKQTELTSVFCALK